MDHLYNGLVDAGICVFRDDDELREGENIGTSLLQAINNSKISIPILSRNYTSSKWCLRELLQMTECMKSVGHVVLPIFYRVEPSEVRYQKGSFGKTFSHFSGKYSEEDIAKWKKALEEVACLKGWESERTANGYFIFLSKPCLLSFDKILLVRALFTLISCSVVIMMYIIGDDCPSNAI